eukprot:Hpha_TRINITY_DN16371_c6_g8::TRINITY_DN16371_c6_g8_i1::g.58569::m.58569
MIEVTKGIRRCCRGAWLVRQGDTPEEAWMKTTLFPYYILLVLFSFAGMVRELLGNNQMVYVLGSGIAGLVCVIFVVGVATNAGPVGYLLDATLLVGTVCVALIDTGWATVSAELRPWAFVVLALDVALVFKRDRMPGFIIPFVLLYMAAMGLESFHRFGLYEAGYWGTTGVEISSCNCASPPCSSSLTLVIFRFANVCAIFLGDFYFTRGFSKGMRLQLRRVEASVQVAGEVTAALARYDVDAAEKAIDGGEDLPEELAESFRRLLSNLRSYQ